eukprot:CAMPEP_0194324334 /NCGR_PEP_ID=MMETSP0171-20130528/27445_1 /TAXON_ID=218684 /ORGANISM="Corethron pennatum, Strain L29A3" /LENGTH=288 /DNA_ID=CAMNT_0039083205 /DNA_START=181 /DNA_END=1047 /DNA_ORIENTATION=+
MEDSTLSTESHPIVSHSEDKTPQQQPASKRPREDPEDVSEPADDSAPQGKTASAANPSAKMRRILSNREHARASYLRKKKLIEDLKKSVTTLEDENKRLREENIALKANRQYNSIGYGGLPGGLPGSLNPQLAGAGHYSRMSAQTQSLSQRRLALLESLTNAHSHSQSSSMLPQQALLGSLGSNRTWASEMAAGAGGSWPLNDRLAEEMMSGGGIGGGGGGMSIPQQQQLQHRAALLEQYQNGGALSQQQQLAMNHGAYGASLMTLERDETQAAQSRLPENIRRVSNN